MNFNELIWFVTNKPYFKVYVLNNGRRVKKFSQVASGNGKGQEFFLIDKSLKMAWFKPETPIIDGLQFITFVDINNAIPLKIEDTTEYETGEFFTKEIKTSIVTKDESKKSGNGKPKKIVEISLPTALLYQMIEAHFVKEIQSVPPSKWEEQKWIWIAAILVFGFIIWQFMSSGALQAIK